MTEARARAAAEAAARGSYGRLIAVLVAQWRDIAAAEDALGDAFASALASWPEHGVPLNPEAWLLTAARNRLRNAFRHAQVKEHAVPELALAIDALAASGALSADGSTAPFPDERLRLLFLCAHPSIDEGIRTPLMLQTVLGLDAVRIASAFLVAPKTMGQRLVRAKAKIKHAGLRFAVPEQAELAARLDDVLAAVYVAFGTSWDAVSAGDEGVRGLTDEAMFLARLLVALLPSQPEPRGLLALLLYCEARRPARRDDAGRFVPLERQDASLWSQEMIAEAEAHLVAAAQHARFGRFQCEAAIQSVHVQRAVTGVTHYSALRTLYDLLVQHAPSLGAELGRAAVLVETGDAAAALTALHAIPRERVKSHQPYWVTRARVERATGDVEGARASLEVAIGLTEDPAVRAFLVDEARA